MISQLIRASDEISEHCHKLENQNDHKVISVYIQTAAFICKHLWQAVSPDSVGDMQCPVSERSHNILKLNPALRLLWQDIISISLTTFPAKPAACKVLKENSINCSSQEIAFYK